MSLLIRFSIDALVPDSINRTQLDSMTIKIMDHTGAVVVYQELNRVITETKPSKAGQGWHVHDGSERCNECRGLSADGKNAVSVESQQ